MRILVISMAGIGDTLLATPLLHELKANYPDAALHALVLWTGSRDVLDGNPHVHTVHQLNVFQVGRLRSLVFLLGLRRNKFDLSINTHPQSRIAYRTIARVIGAPLRLSHTYDNSTPLDRWLVNRTMPQDYSIHTVDNNLRLLEFLGKRPLLKDHTLEVFLSPAETRWADDFVKTHGLTGRKRLGVHVGSGGTKNLVLKRWPLEHYIDLFKKLIPADPRLSILLFGGPEEAQAHERILSACASPQVLAPPTRSLRQAAALLQQCQAFLSVDTALMHLAAAMSVPNQVVIEAPTLNVTNLPYRNPCHVVPNRAVAGRNLEYYRYDGRPIRGTREELVRCMQSVSVQEVLGVLMPLLEPCP